MNNNRITLVCRTIVGEPTVSRRPHVQQRWKQSRQEGGGAVIPCEWSIVCSDTEAPNILGQLKEVIAKIEGGPNMIVLTENVN